MPATKKTPALPKATSSYTQSIHSPTSDKKAQDYIPSLTLPTEGRLLLHSCCAPCSGDIIRSLHTNTIEFVVFFYNPNIHPQKEYEIRKAENARFCQNLGIPCIDGDYDTDAWFARVKGLEDMPERGSRCSVCFDARFERTALYAAENAFPLISSTLGISRWKDMAQINRAGIRAASRYQGVSYWTYNWRKSGGSARMVQLAKEENFYQQEYCGCVYSLRDTNRWRLANGRSRIKIGEKFYGAEK